MSLGNPDQKNRSEYTFEILVALLDEVGVFGFTIHDSVILLPTSETNAGKQHGLSILIRGIRQNIFRIPAVYIKLTLLIF